MPQDESKSRLATLVMKHTFTQLLFTTLKVAATSAVLLIALLLSSDTLRNTTASPTAQLARQAHLQDIFDIRALPSVTLEVSTAEWNRLLTMFDTNRRHENVVRGHFIFSRAGSTERIDDVGFRIKGNSSRQRPEGDIGTPHDAENPRWHLAHYAIDFNAYVKGQHFRSLKKIHLRSFGKDPSLVRSLYAAHLFQAFDVWSAPLASYTKFYLKIEEDAAPVYLGIHQLTEHVDRRFLQARFGEHADGNLWKCSSALNPLPTDSKRMGIERIHPADESLSYRPSFDLKTNKKHLDEAKAQLAAFMSALDAQSDESFETWAEQALDVTLFLRYLAVNTVLGDWDGLWLNDNNYYLYFRETDGKAFVIPHDFENILGEGGLVEDTTLRDPLAFGPTHKGNPLVYRLLRSAKFRAQYKVYLAELIDPRRDLFDRQASVARIRDTFYAVIDPHRNAEQIRNATNSWQRLHDASSPSSNTAQYRLLSGGDDASQANANVFAVRARAIRAALHADRHRSPKSRAALQEAARGPLYLYAAFNTWTAVAATENPAFNQLSAAPSTPHQQTLTLTLPRGVHPFFIADAAMTNTRTFMASRKDSRLAFEDRQSNTIALYPQDTDELLTEAVVAIPHDGHYRLDFDYRDPERMQVSLSLLRRENYHARAGISGGYRSAIYLRGDFNHWQSEHTQLVRQDDSAIYQKVLLLTPGLYEFKIADAHWASTNIGAGDAGAQVILGQTLTLRDHAASQNLSLQIHEQGEYLFRLNAGNSLAPTLTVQPF